MYLSLYSGLNYSILIDTNSNMKYNRHSTHRKTIMGLDSYAYRAHTENAKERWYENAQWDNDVQDFVNSDTVIEKPVELAYWRKHSGCHGFMNQLWQSQGNCGDFNHDELELTLDDLIDFELAVKTQSLPPTTGFFFGQAADDHYYDTDLKFVADAREAIAQGYRVFYNSSW